MQNEGTRILHEQIQEMFEQIYQETKAKDPVVARHLDKAYYTEIIKERLGLNYTLPHLSRIINKARRR